MNVIKQELMSLNDVFISFIDVSNEGIEVAKTHADWENISVFI